MVIMAMMMQVPPQFGILHHLMCVVGVWVLCYKHGTLVECSTVQKLNVGFYGGKLENNHLHFN